MAKATDNVILQGTHGTFAKQVVIRQRFGQSILSKRPTHVKGNPTPAQQVVRERFQTATLYAKSVMANPDLLAQYRAVAKNGQSAYNLALADAFRAPEIREIDTLNYTGKTGSTIRIRAIDDFRVRAVVVSVYSADNQLLETGNAVQQNIGLDWIYTATQEHAPTTGAKIKVQASDLPGNVTLKEQVL